MYSDIKEFNVTVFPFLIGKVLTIDAGKEFGIVEQFPFLIGKVLTRKF